MPRKKKSIDFVIYVPIFDVEVLYMKCDYSEIYSVLDKYQSPIELYCFDSCEWCSIIYEDNNWVKWLSTYVDKKWDWWLLAHELYHTAVKVLEAKWIENNEHTEEVIAQLLSFLVREVLHLSKNA